MQLNRLSFLLFVVLGTLTVIVGMNPQWFMSPMLHVVSALIPGFFAFVCLVRAFEKL